MAGKRRLSDTDVVLNLQYDTYRRTARRRGIVFELTLEEAKALFVQPCHYCEHQDRRCAAPSRYATPICVLANGIDRVDNRRGYQDGNVVPACRTCNRSKSDLELQEWLAWAERVVRRRHPKSRKRRRASAA